MLNKKSIFIILVLFLFFSACTKRAIVEIENIGDIPISASASGDYMIVDSYCSSIWEIRWSGVSFNSSRTIELYAEPVGYPGAYDSIIITLRNGDDYLWQIGWEEIYTGKVKVIKHR